MKILSSSTDLNTLKQTLVDQAKSTGKIVLNETVLSASDIANITTLFLLGSTVGVTKFQMEADGWPLDSIASQINQLKDCQLDNSFPIANFEMNSTTGYLIIDQISVSDIHDPIDGKLTVQAGKTTVFNQTIPAPQLIFSIDDKGSIQLVISLPLSADWTFDKSFPNLILFPFSHLSVSQSFFIYSSIPISQYYPWTTEPQETIALAAGLNFCSWATPDILSGAVQLLQNILGISPLKLSGPFSPNSLYPYPVTRLLMPLANRTFPITSSFSIGNFSLAAIVEEPVNRIQRISLDFIADMNNLEFSIGVTGGDPSLIFGAGPKPGTVVTGEQILQIPGGDNYTQYIPDVVNKAFSSVALNSFSVVIAFPQKITYVSLSIGSIPDFKWTLIPDVLVLEGISLGVAYFDPFGPDKSALITLDATCQIFPTIFTGDFEFTMQLELSNNKWMIQEISGNYYGSATLYDIVHGVAPGSGQLPDVLKNITFSNFGLIASSDGSGYTYAFHGQCGAEFAIANTSCVFSLLVVGNYAKTGYNIDLLGNFLIGSQNFSIELILNRTNAVVGANPADSVLKAKWKALNEDYLEFEDIANAFGFSPPSIPKDLDLALKSASLTYDFTKEILVLEAESANYGKAIFVALKNNQKWQFFFGLDIDKPISLTNLPLLRDLIHSQDAVEINGIQVVISSDTINDSLAQTINSLIDEFYPKVPDTNKQGMAKGLNFAMNFAIAGTKIPLVFSTGSQTKNPEPSLDFAPRTNLPTVATPANSSISSSTSSDGVVWFNIQKTFGPVNIQKIGVLYKDSQIEVLINASLSASGLIIGLNGFGIGSSIKNFDPFFTIQGIDVTYSGGGVEISGGLMGTIDPLNFVGELMVNFETLGIAGLAGYTTIDGNPSLFLYAVLNYPIGGPAFFFVTGLAAGFGFNRTLIVPDVSGVSTFPLVQWAQGVNAPGMNMQGNIGDQVNQVLQTLQTSGVVAPTVGEYWLALGIKFTSFELVNSFALAVVKFGAEFEIDILGTSTISLPPGDPVPVAYAELQLLVSLKPDSGLFAIAGQLTPNSYVLSQACHLTGGFAYYFWFAGDNAGQFVMTLGGYNPHYTPPLFFPKVPRLGINWQVSDMLIIKGEEYFAITSRAIMAGGGLSATWSSGPISAWFSVHADFLIVYLPFHYYISASVSIGASFSIDLFFFSITITIHVGADLEIWGPEFTGIATVDLDIVSFTIRFNDSAKSSQTTIEWDQFVTQLLTPKASSSNNLLNAASLKDSTNPKMLNINMSSGLIKQLSDDGSQLDFVVNSEQFEMTVTTVIPNKVYQMNDQLILAPSKDQPQRNNAPITPNQNFGVGPTGTDSNNFTSNITVTITSTNNASVEPELQAIYIFSNIAKSLWEKTNFDGNQTPVISDPLNDTTINDVVTGFKIVPIPKTPDHTLPISLEYLNYTIDDNIQHFSWSNGYVAITDPFNKETVQSTIESSIAQKNRTQILAAVNLIVAFDKTIDVQDLADPCKYDLMAEPVLKLLGEN